ncbi:ADP-ribosyl cyclase/cyclic ADP-ribose hydrolase 1 isoform X2 [Ictalurus punctatus]|uniref:ADP-ribosyl cyclase/cyclic ADP-ribose hydrolase n=1 Tax=Ictalurus punctatus TaxID=7998 RepID=A0A9F7QVD6_ICTPU|nr:ADP-ribosyl cyclase/cyclic ADP-ribose hydrolase 1 isoform X2 [Ictalurus punctatus]
MISELFIIIILTGHINTDSGTTPNIKQIVIGRCYEYITLVNPSYRYECEEIWHEFEEAVVRTTPCSVRMKDYERMFHAAPQTPPCDKLLFWSKTQTLMQRNLAVIGSLWTLEDTLVGFMFKDLIWCGQQERDRGFDFLSCPEWSTCVSHPVYSLWKQASQNHVWECGARQSEPQDGGPCPHQSCSKLRRPICVRENGKVTLLQSGVIYVHAPFNPISPFLCKELPSYVTSSRYV